MILKFERALSKKNRFLLSRASERGVQLENELMCVCVHVYEPTSEWTGKQDERERILNATKYTIVHAIRIHERFNEGLLFYLLTALRFVCYANLIGFSLFSLRIYPVQSIGFKCFSAKLFGFVKCTEKFRDFNPNEIIWINKKILVQNFRFVLLFIYRCQMRQYIAFVELTNNLFS